MRFLWLMGVAVLAGCGAWAKPGGSPAELKADQHACGLEAAKAHPPRMMSAPGFPTAADNSCATIYGQAQCAPLATQQPGTQTDLNAGGRHVAFEQCLKSKGYTYATH